ncbi:MAG: hypothetical protein ACOY4W_03670 [Thermodesulfobacteriota bacterium]
MDGNRIADDGGQEWEEFRRRLIRLVDDMEEMANDQLLGGPAGEVVRCLLFAATTVIREMDDAGLAPMVMVVVDGPAPTHHHNKKLLRVFTPEHKEKDEVVEAMGRVLLILASESAQLPADDPPLPC